MSKIRKPPTFRDAVKAHGDSRDQLTLRRSGTNARTHSQDRSSFERVGPDAIKPGLVADVRQSERGYPQQSKRSYQSSIPISDRHIVQSNDAGEQQARRELTMAIEHEMLEKHPSTIILRKLGLTDEHLDAIRFSRRYRDRPFDEWPLTWHPSVLVETCPTILKYMRDFASYRFALIDGPAGGAAGVSEAFSHVSETLTAALVEDRLRYLASQKDKSKKARGIIPEVGMTIREFVKEFARKPDNRPLSPRELWPSFGSEMGFNRLDPRKVGETYRYLVDKSIAFRTFANYVREARNEDKTR
jgi:hypothetical protein